MPRTIAEKCVRCLSQVEQSHDEHLSDVLWLERAKAIADQGRTTCQVCLELHRLLALPMTEKRLRDKARRLLWQRGYYFAA